MGFKTGNLPPVDPATFHERPFFERIRILATQWAEYGFGTPKMVHVIYIVKLLVLYVVGGLFVATATSGLGPFWDVAAWWPELIVYEKLILWTVLLETLGLAGSWGPLAAHFKPMTGGFRYWARPDTIRLPPWPDKVPFTRGDRRTRRRRRPLPGDRRHRGRRAGRADRHPDRRQPGQPGAAAHADRPARRDGPARQGRVPRRPQRAVPAGAGLLRRPRAGRPDRRLEAADRRGVDRCRRLEVRPPLLTRRRADGQQHARGRRERSSGSTTAASPTTCARRTPPACSPTSAARPSRSCCPSCCCSRRTRPSRCSR